MRFETMYTTPRFVLRPYARPPALASAIHSSIQLDGSASSKKALYCEESGHNSTTELASWSKLIEALHANSEIILSLAGEGELAIWN